MSTDITSGTHYYDKKKRKRKVKKNQNLRARKTNEDAERVASIQTFSQASLEGASTDAECITDLYSTGHVRSGTSIDEQVICQVNEGLNLPSDAQHGFMPRRSCLTNLIVAEEFITGMTDQGEPMDVVYLDFSKAFDSVCHRLVVKKMVTMGINLKITRWVEELLNNRTF